MAIRVLATTDRRQAAVYPNPPGGSAAVQRPSRILVSAASRHGATEEIARRIAGRLRALGPGTTVTLRAFASGDSLAGFDVYVLGSAIYLGRWLEPAEAVIEANAVHLRRGDVWLFSSGPVGAPPSPADIPAATRALARRVGAIDHAVFGGLLDVERLDAAERSLVRALRVADGDFRDWSAIDGWADAIGERIRPLARVP